MRFLVLACVLFLASFALAEEVPELAWNDLIPKAEEPVDDPFAELSKEQLRDLGMIARFRMLRDRDAIDPDGESARNEKRLVAEFEAQDIDVDWILSQRGRVTRERRERAERIDSSVAGKTVRIPGYILPLREDGDEIAEFLLVPWVGACIHTPPPPPNQMIHVSVPGGTPRRGRYAPIWIEGQIELKPAQYEIFLVDGSGVVKVAYSMSTSLISDYSARDSTILSQVEIPEEALEGHNWLQRWQAKVSILFTKTMTDIRDRKSSGPLFAGLLIAFLYGVVHTLGPGHGKAVVVSYFVGEGSTLSRGIRMGVLIAVFHVLSAVVIIGVTHFLVKGVTGQAPANYRIVKLLSYGAIVVIGSTMLWKALRGRPHQHDHSHDPDPNSHSPVGHTHGNEAGSHEGCHLCDALEKKRKSTGDWVALAVGAVPCTGALLVLLFGFANNLLGSAVLLVACISGGMALAMSGIGVLAIMGRKSVERRWEADSERLARFSSRAGIAGALLITAIGTTLFVVTLQS